MNTKMEGVINHIKDLLDQMQLEVQESFNISMLALKRTDGSLAKQVIQKDKVIDQLDTQLENACMKLLNLFHPVAVDSRFMISVLKNTRALEKIGDLCVEISRNLFMISETPTFTLHQKFLDLIRNTQRVVALGLEALSDQDLSYAKEVLEIEEKIDIEYEHAMQNMKILFENNPNEIENLMRVQTILGDLEEISDQSKKIAESVIFFLSAENVAHQTYTPEILSGVS